MVAAAAMLHARAGDPNSRGALTAISQLCETHDELTMPSHLILLLP